MGGLVALVVVLCHVADACNVRELSEIIQNRFRKESTLCGVLGDKCTFDRDCCRGLECKMSVSNKVGVDNYCQKMVGSVGRGDLGEAIVDSEEPSSPEDGNWMIVRSEETDELKNEGAENKREKPTDTIGEIEGLQEKRRFQLVRENEELERLFTEKDERELEQLRALKEDVEMDELRRLKELRLKRKLQLLKELQELRGTKAEEDLERINEIRNKTKPTEDLQEETATYNETSVKEDQQEQQQEEANPEPGIPPDEEVPAETEQPKELEELVEEEKEPETTTVKQKQGGHRRRKHHQTKHKKRAQQGLSGNSTSQIQESYLQNTEQPETTVQENEGGNKTETPVS